MAQALYRKYRSQTLGEIVGQNHITSVLEKSLDQGLISHAYLFTGPRGVGKTSVARILANIINHTQPNETNLDIIEIDAASNNSVEDIRDLREKSQIAPVSAPKKIYIIDEVHMLSRSAFNALLKTLEEPPEHVVFILATTNPDKLPDTIISRTQHFAFRNLPINLIEKQLALVSEQEKIKIDKDALAIIARQARGGMRDALSLLDQLSSLGKDNENITADLVTQTLGMASVGDIQELISSAIADDFTKIKSKLDELLAKGVSGAGLLDQLINEILIQSQENTELISLLSSLAKLDKRENYIDVRILTTLGLFNNNHSTNIIDKNKSKITMRPTVKTAKAKTVPLNTAPAVIVSEMSVKLPKVDAKNTSSTNKNLQDFNWQNLVENSRQKHMALASLVVKCKYELIPEKNRLTLYTINKFNKKKLDDPKYLPVLYTVLAELGFEDLEIETIPSGPPPKGGVESKVANIMGGGEVVEVDI